MPFDAMPVIPQVVLDLIAARNFLEDHGWCKHTLKNGDARCLAGAIREVTAEGDLRIKTPRSVAAERAVTDTINANRRSLYRTSIARFNDRRSTTFSDVKLMLEKAVANELAKEKVYG